MPLRPNTPAAPETGRLSFADIAGWAQDDLAAALAAYGREANVADAASDPREYLERMFRPGRPLAGHFTGYYEPELDGSLTRTDAFPVPVHALPPDGGGLPRAGIDAALAGYEIAWLRDEVDRFFLQVQGSGRLRLNGGQTLRLGYAGKNGHAYRSIGKLLIERGVFGVDITADALKAWLRADAGRAREVMSENPSYVFFRRLTAPLDTGPTGAMGHPVTAGRSLAVDPDCLPLGSLVWIEVADIRRLCVAQDTGSAIKGPGRADLFFGTGDAAGLAAGRLNHPGRFLPLVPK